MVELDERPVITESVVQPCACVLTSRETSPLDMLQLVFAPHLQEYEAFLELKGIHRRYSEMLRIPKIVQGFY